jgi:hypothetical protein
MWVLDLVLVLVSSCGTSTSAIIRFGASTNASTSERAMLNSWLRQIVEHRL